LKLFSSDGAMRDSGAFCAWNGVWKMVLEEFAECAGNKLPDGEKLELHSFSSSNPPQNRGR
jgi:hypothetical protein